MRNISRFGILFAAIGLSMVCFVNADHSNEKGFRIYEHPVAILGICVTLLSCVVIVFGSRRKKKAPVS